MQHIGPNPNLLNKLEISRLDIIEAISKMDNKKISEADPCPVHVLKRFKEIFAEPLQILFQRSLNEGKFPAILKKATVVPIFKNRGRRYDPAHYRPISLLPTLSKIFETIVCQKLTAYLNENNLFAHEQHGFRKSRSTQSIPMDAAFQSTSMASHPLTTRWIKACPKVPFWDLCSTVFMSTKSLSVFLNPSAYSTQTT